MDCPTSSKPWLADLGTRLGAQWRLKMFGIPTFIAIFFAGYFLLLRYPLFDVTVMPVTALDEAIPFQPASSLIYFSLWLYVSLAPALLRERRELLFHGKVASALGLTGMVIFLFWPTTIPLGAGLNEQELGGLAWLKEVDAGGNACPSLHVAFAVFAGWWLDRAFVEMRLPALVRLFNLVWCGGIAYSTLATKQHVAIDVVAGAVLGAIAASFGCGKAIEKPLAA
jgi:membrane-associated phospholipid phosphatase